MLENGRDWTQSPLEEREMSGLNFFQLSRGKERKTLGEC